MGRLKPRASLQYGLVWRPPRPTSPLRPRSLAATGRQCSRWPIRLALDKGPHVAAWPLLTEVAAGLGSAPPRSLFPWYVLYVVHKSSGSAPAPACSATSGSNAAPSSSPRRRPPPWWSRPTGRRSWSRRTTSSSSQTHTCLWRPGRASSFLDYWQTFLWHKFYINLFSFAWRKTVLSINSWEYRNLLPHVVK